jgi:hypothetical protein
MVKYIVTSFSSAESHYAYDYGQEDYLKVTLFQAVELLLFIETNGWVSRVGGLHVRNWDTMHQNTLGLPKIGYLLQVMPMYQ